jgi:hypothetical protein
MQGDLDTSQVARRYKAWLERKGVQHVCCGVAHFPDTGRGAMATRDIAPDEVVIQVPPRLVFSRYSGGLVITGRQVHDSRLVGVACGCGCGTAVPHPPDEKSCRAVSQRRHVPTAAPASSAHTLVPHFGHSNKSAAVSPRDPHVSREIFLTVPHIHRCYALLRCPYP